MKDLEHWFRYEFLPREPDGAMWRDKPVAEAALHFLKQLEDDRRFGQPHFGHDEG